MDRILAYDIVPPVKSGKITTKNHFSFKYGKLEIRAKLPKGKWIYPELYLQPQTSKYGVLRYESGLIRVAFARGNDRIDHSGYDIGNKQLSAGIFLDDMQPCRNNWIVTSESIEPWGNDFHNFSMVWSEAEIKFEVDGKDLGSIAPPPGGFRASAGACPNFYPQAKIWSNGTILAPFDEEFYITIGVGVGGLVDFPDDIENKGWTNTHPKAKNQFFNDRKEWIKSWNEASALVVDRVRVWAN